MERIENVGRVVMLPFGLAIFFTAFAVCVCLAGLLMVFGVCSYCRLALANKI